MLTGIFSVCSMFSLLLHGKRYRSRVKKAEIEYTIEHGEVINYTLDGVTILTVIRKIQAFFLTD